ncbi:MAG: thiamine pyrophosphate-dependent dehydrogenase E1 component subunit alpha [Sphingopyxis sp.]|nr:thiamine pyrophosphate-dependent dehydrogenase E1 component subunit alpha [Sphingopyxis sp.]
MRKQKAESGPDTAQLPRWLDFHRSMHIIRQVESRLATLFADGEIPGFIHLSIGQEASAVGVCAALELADTIASTHRGHGHAVAKGMALDRFFLEILGKDEGACRGRSGSMHIADMGVGMLGANGIVGGGLPLAIGSALAHKLKGNGAVAVACFGDGAMAEGILHEALNIASLWKLPVLFVCDNNGWSEFSATKDVISLDLPQLARAFGIASRHLRGDDVVAVAEAAGQLVDAIRGDGAPRLIELHTRRIRGHFEGDAQRYRHDDAADREDPLVNHESRLLRAGVTPERLAEIAEAARGEVEAALQIARAGRAACAVGALDAVYAQRGAARYG